MVANKADDGKDLYDQYDFYKLGLGDPWPISAATGSGTGDLLDKVLEILPEKAKDDLEEGIPRFAVVGRPNAGKSSIINAFIGEDRNIVTEIAGTTRDPRVLFSDALHPCHREQRCLYPHDRCHPWYRGSGYEYLPADSEEQQVAGGSRE